MSRYGDVEVAGVRVAFDPDLGCYCIFASVPRARTVHFKLLVESYEGIGVARSLDPEHEPGRALACVLAVADFIATTVGLIEELAARGELRVLEPTPLMARKARTDVLVDS